LIATDDLSVAEVRARLSATVVGRHLYRLGEVDSTNSVACRLAREGALEGTVVLADAQTEGVGRLGQPWFSPPGLNLYISVLFRPACHVREAARFSLIAPLAACDAIEDLGLSPALNWPNDVLVGGHKVAGAHTEIAARGEEIAHLALGIAVNVNVERAALRDALGSAGANATSLRAALGRVVSRSALAAAYLSRLDVWARRYDEDGPGRILAAWCDGDVLIGRRIGARNDRTIFEGRARGRNPSGSVALEASGARRRALGADGTRSIEASETAGRAPALAAGRHGGDR